MKTQSNLLTVDLEEWFVVEALADRYSVDDWPNLESTLERNCDRLLFLLERKDVQATWFVLGWCASRYPDLIRRIAEAGHETACHSYLHRRVNQLSPDEFRRDTEEAISAIVDITGIRPLGYRAPSWSLDESVPWAFEILAQLGFEYDSSVFPIKHDIYGMPSGPRHLSQMTVDTGESLYEVPASTYRFLGQNIPLGGGGYLRHSPYWYSLKMIRNLNRQGYPVVVYLHPWEIDPNPPRIGGLSMVQRFRTYGSTDTMAHKLERMLDDLDFTAVINHVRHETRHKIGFER
ncbi:MAG: polysaccharide deacetylase family protein [Candidatus Zixiibacteriota bacterium]|nr:MAG: polysaccharide deacetylase family protein [candidate division Zixibacteria bacterium]